MEASAPNLVLLYEDLRAIGVFFWVRSPVNPENQITEYLLLTHTECQFSWTLLNTINDLEEKVRDRAGTECRTYGSPDPKSTHKHTAKHA